MEEKEETVIELRVSEEYENRVAVPSKGTSGSAGYDIMAAETVIIPSLLKKNSKDFGILTIEQAQKALNFANETTFIETGLSFYTNDESYYLDLRPRSGIASKTLLIMPNTPGTIDADFYPNTMKIPLINLSPYDIMIKEGERVAQGIIQKHYKCTNEDTVETIRDGGFGSTGIE